MNIKKYIARNNQEAIRMVKKEMGPEAIILRTRTIFLPEQGLDGPSEKIEVTAAVDYDSPGKIFREKDPRDPKFDQRQWRYLEKEIREIKEALWCADAKNVSMPEFYFKHIQYFHYEFLYSW